MVTVSVMFHLLGVPLVVPIAFGLTWGVWTAVMLCAYVTGSQKLMRASAWGIGLFAILPIVLVFITAR
jgi:E3 ubiquitin-protein ligase DOA10